MKLIASIDSDIGAALQRSFSNQALTCTSRRPGPNVPLELAHPLTWPKFEPQSIDETWYTIGIGDGRSTRNEVVQVNAFLSCDFLGQLASRGMRDGGKIVVLSSEWGSISRTSTSTGRLGNIAYRMSKAALNMGVAFLARRHPQFNWIIMQPGWVSTKLNRMAGADALTPESSANQMIGAVAKETRQFCFIDYLGNDVEF
jgi:NAD(P)-dependent dehydrogenase (short-subunit alcohol dehydrogenase family)